MDDAVPEPRSDELQRRFFAVSIDLLCLVDYSGCFERVNPAWERTLGYATTELISRPFIDFVHPDDRELTLAANETVRAGVPAIGFENRYMCKDGSVRWLRWSSLSDPASNMIYAVARDVTEQKLADAERERLIAELQAALAEVRQLQSILPMCSYCRKIRDDADAWHSVESYLAQHTSTRVSHGVCPQCMATEFEPQLRRLRGDLQG